MNKTHGLSKTRVYRIWRNAISRTENPNVPCYHNYADYEIRMCDEWRNSFEAFYKWAIENGYDDKLTLDRIDNDGDYTPKNCRWVDMKTQSNNRGHRKAKVDESLY